MNYCDIMWDNNVVDYDIERFPWYDRILSVIQEVKPECPSIEQLHEYFDRNEIVPLRKKVEKFVRTKEFSGWVDDYFNCIIGEGDYLIQATPTLNFVLPDQQRQGSLLTFHTGHLTDTTTVLIPSGLQYLQHMILILCK